MIPLLTVQCTDNGAHNPRTLARLSIGIKDGRVVMGRQGRTRHHTTDGRFVVPRGTEGAADARRRDDGGVTFTFTCPSCRRNVPLRDDRLAALAGVAPDEMTNQPDDGRLAWDVSSVDISHLRT
jgi:hypothetical protein